MSEPIAKKSLGQHWLHDKTVLTGIVTGAGVKPGDTVLEIGPGTGTLTEVLLDAGAKVIALEFDEILVPILRQKFSGREVTVEQGDIRKFDLTALPYPYKIVANIPYYLTANLLRLLTDTPAKPELAALLVQKEVAERVAAKPGQMSFISVAAQFYYKVSLGERVPAKLFTPPPKVDSQVLVLTRKQLLVDAPAKDFFRVAKAGFSARRKTLLNSLSGGLRLEKGQVTSLLAAADINPQARPQELSLEDWQKIYMAVNL